MNYPPCGDMCGEGILYVAFFNLLVSVFHIYAFSLSSVNFLLLLNIIYRSAKHAHDLTFPQKKLEATSENNAASNHTTGSVASTQKNNECCEKRSESQVRHPFLFNFAKYLVACQYLSFQYGEYGTVGTHWTDIKSPKFYLLPSLSLLCLKSITSLLV